MISFILGYLLFYFTSSEETGGENKFDKWVYETFGIYVSTSLKFNSHNYDFHIHHWVILFLLGFMIEHSMFRLFCIGGIFQSFSHYWDCFDIIKLKSKVLVNGETKKK